MSSSRFHAPVPLGQLSAPEPVPSLVRGLLDKGSLAVLYGPSGSSKTFLALELAHSVATGRQFLSMDVEPGGVLVIAAESPQSSSNRLMALDQEYPSPHAGRLWMTDRALHLQDPGRAIDQLVGWAKDPDDPKGISLVIIDTYAASNVGADENLARDSGVAIDKLASLRRELGATVVLVAHSGKDPDRGIRGSSALHAAADSVFEARSDSDAFIFSVRKQRDHHQITPVTYKLRPVQVVTNPGQDPVGTCVIELVEGSRRKGSAERDDLLLHIIAKYLETQNPEGKFTTGTHSEGMPRESARNQFLQQIKIKLPQYENHLRETLAKYFNRALTNLKRENRVVEIDGHLTTSTADDARPDAE